VPVAIEIPALRIAGALGSIDGIENSQNRFAAPETRSARISGAVGRQP